MKLSTRIFLGYFLIVALAGYFLLKSVRDELRPAVRQSMEETLIDTANLLAEIVERDVENNQIQTGNFSQAVEDFVKRQPGANIWGFSKNAINNRIYVTDENGVVIYDSDDGRDIGKDYSRWNDVYLTLRGQYGARSTKLNPDDEQSSVMHVAAPIVSEGRIIGVLTVSKPNISVLPFIQRTQRNIANAGFVLFAIALLLGWAISAFIATSTRKLAHYADRVAAGEKASLPNISEPELSKLGHAIKSMRSALEGKEYVERYVHTLTHEIKSPLSGIRGASELLSEKMSAEDQARFIKNIREDGKRIQSIIDRLLDLARLEQKQDLDDRKTINVKDMVDSVVESLSSQLQQKEMRCDIELDDNQPISGDPFLIRQAINNILDNAIDFSLESSTITIKGYIENGRYILSFKDQGSGVPDYAQDQIFERFYSLPRPQTGQKSSGLGLSFVREVMLLHDGQVTVSNIEGDTGCLVTLSFPLK